MILQECSCLCAVSWVDIQLQIILGANLSIAQCSLVRSLSFSLKESNKEDAQVIWSMEDGAPWDTIAFDVSLCCPRSYWKWQRSLSFILYNMPLLFPTFVNQSPAHQFGKLQTVEGENVVEDDGPEVGSVEHTTDPAWHSLTHNTLETEETGTHAEILCKTKCHKVIYVYLFPTLVSFIFLTSMVENGGREKNLATHSSKLRPKQLKKDQR